MHRRSSLLALVALAVAACSDGTTTPAPRTLAPAAAAADVNPDLDGDVYNYVTWTAANPLGGTASGTITLPDGHTVGVDFRVVQSSGAAGTYFAALYDAGSGVQAVSNPSIGNLSVGNYWLGPNNEAPFKSTSVANGPSNATMIALTGDITDSYVLTFSEPVQDPIMDILSLGSTGNSAEYDFGRQVELLSQGTGFWGGGSSSLTLMNGQNLVGREGNGTVRFIGSMSTLSWTVPDGEVFHNFTVAIRGLANPNADFDGDGVPDAIDNCPTTANANQADADFDGIGDACDPVNDPTVDTDGDGLTNAQEHAIGTSPTNPDTDGDGFTDKVDAFPLDPSRHLPDTTPPVIAYTVTGDVGSDNWYTSNVHVAWSVTDPDTPVSAKDGCVDTDLTSNTTAEGVTLTCAATSGGGTAPSQSVTIKIDKTIPSVTGAVTSGTPGTNGWYTTPVGITWTPSAAGPSGQNLSSDCSEVTTGETAGHTFTCTVTTGAGIASAPGAVTVKVDETKPVVTYTGNAGSYSVLQTVNILCAATDNLSGVASSTCQQITGPAYGYALGQHTFSATATDNAGNTGSGATAVNVVVASGDICTLTEAWVTQPGKGGGIANSLCVKLRHAQYGAYINEVSAQSGKAIATDKAAILIGLAKLM